MGFEFSTGRGTIGTAIPRHSFSILKFLIPVALILSITTFYLFHSHEEYPVPDFEDFSGNANEGSFAQPPPFELEPIPPPPPPIDPKVEFIQNVIDNEIDGPYDLTPLSDFCAKREHAQPGLIVKCQSPQGGMGNLRNMMLDCYRFAFEAGASSIIVPEFVKRSTTDLSQLNTDIYIPFSYVFDLDHFVTSFRSACPQVHLFLTKEEVLDLHPNITDLRGGHEQNRLKVWGLPGTIMDDPANTIIKNIESWRSRFDVWMNKTHPSFDAHNPTVVTIETPLLRFPMTVDEPAFVATYGRLVKFREDTRRLAAAVLYAMSQKYSLDLDFSNPAGGVEAGKFYGAHLRTSVDALKVGWPGYDIQARNYLRASAANNLSLIYLSSGNMEDVKRFSDSARNMSIAVTMKEDLLAEPGFEEEKAAMEALTWDQKGLIDYEVLLRCSQFGGMFESSFSWNLVNKRHVVVGGGKWEYIGEGQAGVGPVGPEAFQDALSTIYGPKDLGRLRWQFPLALWP